LYNFFSGAAAYWDAGDAEYTCRCCQAKVWYQERTRLTCNPINPKFSICCGDGKVVLPLLTQPPPLLVQLMDYNGGQRSKFFRKHLKLINAMFAFTSTGGNIHIGINDGRGPYAFRLNGHNHHRIGTLLPTHEDGRPRFAQLYINDTENEVENRFYALHCRLPLAADDRLLRILVSELIQMLNQHNRLVQVFRMVRDRLAEGSMQPVTLRLLGTRRRDGRQYNLPTASEIAALIPGDGNPTDNRDIIVQERGSENVRRISELHPSFMALQYPLLFPYGEDGYHIKIPLSRSDNRREFVSLREYYAYRLHTRLDDGGVLLKGGRLFHTFIVDAYAAVLDHDLNWYKLNQNAIRAELYNGLQDRITSGETNLDTIGRRIILPSSFTGGPRHMVQQYQDAMAICRWAGTPDLFVTMTCNPRWPEIERFVQQHYPGQPPVDRPELVTRMFKIKLEELMKDIRKENYFGPVKAGINIFIVQLIFMIDFFFKCHTFLRMLNK